MCTRIAHLTDCLDAPRPLPSVRGGSSGEARTLCSSTAVASINIPLSPRTELPVRSEPSCLAFPTCAEATNTGSEVLANATIGESLGSHLPLRPPRQPLQAPPLALNSRFPCSCYNKAAEERLKSEEVLGAPAWGRLTEKSGFSDFFSAQPSSTLLGLGLPEAQLLQRLPAISRLSEYNQGEFKIAVTYRQYNHGRAGDIRIPG